MIPDIHSLLLPAAALLLTAGISMTFLARRRRRKLQEEQKIKELQKKVMAALEGDETEEVDTAGFATTLSDAALTTRLQQPRMQLQSGLRGDAPEKYRFFNNLIGKGMNAEEIAEVLDISPAEAAQLVRLHGVGNGLGT